MHKNHAKRQKVAQNGKKRVLARVLSEELSQVTGGTFTQMPDPDDYDTDGGRFRT